VLFNSYVFIFCFLPIVLAGYLLLRRAVQPLWPIAWLVLASLVYYSWWRPVYLLLLLFSVAVNYGFGKLIIDGGRRTDVHVSVADDGRTTGAVVVLGTAARPVPRCPLSREGDGVVQAT
jgi:hypothetical protein